jgi:DNA-binding transcriptional ArsR family regulator
MNDQPLTPLDHRARRRIMRHLHEARGVATADELSRDLKMEVTEVAYHARVLAKYDFLEERRKGRVLADTRFESKVADDPEVIAQLLSTEAADERE